MAIAELLNHGSRDRRTAASSTLRQLDCPADCRECPHTPDNIAIANFNVIISVGFRFKRRPP